MKKFLFLVLALLLMGSFTGLFAEHARVMPTDVGRVYFAPSYIWGNKSFDDDAEKHKTGTPLKFFNMGLALEHGVNSWLTAALQWTPGYNLYSKIDRPTVGDADAKDMGDLFVGAKTQLIGPKALLVQSDQMRFAIAPGLKVPLTSGPDFEKEFNKIGANDDYTAAKLDKHVIGAGWRLYYDYLFTKEFYINFYNQTIFYPMKGKFKHSDLGAIGALRGVNAPAAYNGAVRAGDVDYKYDIVFEVEPNYTFEIAPKTTFEFGLPINYTANPAAEYEFSSSAAGGVEAAKTNVKDNASNGKKTQIITVKPTIGVFFTDWAVPIEIKLGYFVPVWGKNTKANNTINSQIRVYYKI